MREAFTHRGYPEPSKQPKITYSEGDLRLLQEVLQAQAEHERADQEGQTYYGGSK